MQTSSQIRTYKRNECITFRKTKEAFGGLSNMAGGYPLKVNGIHILTSEALYQACRFPHLPEIQQLIIAQKSPMTAKMKSKPYRDKSRSDWEQVRVKVMRWCLRVKLLQNWNKFGKLLLETGDKAIVEDSHKDDFWGAIPTDNDTLIGVNALGRFLMELREDFKNDPESLKSVKPLNIRDFLLLSKPIETITVDPEKLTTFDIEKQQLNAESLTGIHSDHPLTTSSNENISIYSEEKSGLSKNTDDIDKEDSIFDDYILPKLEKILQTPRKIDEILDINIFNTVKKSQMQNWLLLGYESGKLNRLERPVRYVWHSVPEYESYSYKNAEPNKLITTSKQKSNSQKENKPNYSQNAQQLSFL